MGDSTREQLRSQAFVLVESEIPPGVTIAEYRASRPASSTRRRRLLIRRRRRA